ncbi:microfibril-associated glycoprotein 4-like [Oratosquilla oratoria]|uniref:microfibril-associated glycoprotein 4-like n=1 Tax=Oratosquilla oratoria TaxID=337810 RepID=UPI003F776606
MTIYSEAINILSEEHTSIRQRHITVSPYTRKQDAREDSRAPAASDLVLYFGHRSSLWRTQAIDGLCLFAPGVGRVRTFMRHICQARFRNYRTQQTLPLQALLHALQNLTQSPSKSQTPKTESSRPRHCFDLKKAGDSGRGVRRIYPFPCCPNWVLQVFCDQETYGGGWTVVQRRDDLPPYEEFYRTWLEYEKGFGDVEGEHWLGLENIHHLTSHSLQELRIDLADFENATRWANYGFFHVQDSNSKYVMNCGSYKYTGDAGDSLSYHSAQKFSTHDNDNDEGTRNCAVSFSGAWWYKDCTHSNLNGKYRKGTTGSFPDGVLWRHWRGYHYSLRKTEMKIRPSPHLRISHMRR